MVIRQVCPRCTSGQWKKHGHLHNGKQNHHCHDCGRQCVDCFAQDLIAEDRRGRIERVRVERIALRGIWRAVGGTRKWVVGFLVQCFAALPDHLHGQPGRGTQDVMLQRLAVEADAMASFVQQKAHTPWVWLAMDAKSRQIIAFHGGDRSRRSATRRWAKSPHAYRQHATLYTDQSVVYDGVLPTAQHKAISKLARQTKHIERCNNPLRQRVSRLVRDARSVSKELANHIGAIKLFSCHDNLTRAAA